MNGLIYICPNKNFLFFFLDWNLLWMNWPEVKGEILLMKNEKPFYIFFYFVMYYNPYSENKIVFNKLRYPINYNRRKRPFLIIRKKRRSKIYARKDYWFRSSVFSFTSKSSAYFPPTADKLLYEEEKGEKKLHCSISIWRNEYRNRRLEAANCCKTEYEHTENYKIQSDVKKKRVSIVFHLQFTTSCIRYTICRGGRWAGAWVGTKTAI